MNRRKFLKALGVGVVASQFPVGSLTPLGLLPGSVPYAPPEIPDGSVWFDTSNNSLLICKNKTWIAFTGEMIPRRFS